MKNCNIGRGIAVLLTSTVLLGGCSSTEQAIEEKRVPIDNCRHVIVNFGNQKIIFKTYITKLQQFGFCPYSPNRIVWIT